MSISTRIAVSILLVIAYSGAPLGASAHHSANAYDLARTVEVKGVLREFRYQNPHTMWLLDVTDANGKVINWVIEGNPPNWFRSAGIRKADFDKGLNQAVSMDIHPSKDGAAIGYFQKITFPDGTFVRFGDTVK
jgi:hypothetical protein